MILVNTTEHSFKAFRPIMQFQSQSHKSLVWSCINEELLIRHKHIKKLICTIIINAECAERIIKFLILAAPFISSRTLITSVSWMLDCYSNEDWHCDACSSGSNLYVRTQEFSNWWNSANEDWQILNCPQDGNILKAEAATDGHIRCLTPYWFTNDSFPKQNLKFLQWFYLIFM